MVKLSHRLWQGISYDRLQKQLTEKTMQVCQQVGQNEVYILADTLLDVLRINLPWTILIGYRELLKVEVSM